MPHADNELPLQIKNCVLQDLPSWPLCIPHGNGILLYLTRIDNFSEFVYHIFAF